MRTAKVSLFSELKRRNVFRVLIAYAVVAWILMQIGDTLAPALHLPDWATSFLAYILILGFPLAAFFAWAYEMTPNGLRAEQSADRDRPKSRSNGRTFNTITVFLLVIAVSYFAFDKFIATPQQTDTKTATAVPETKRVSIAVLPFINMSADDEQGYFSDGLSEELLNLLAKIPELRVTSRSSAFSYKGKDFKIADVGRELDVDYVLEGSVRKSGDQIRITAQLINVSDDTHLWSETWDREFTNVFAIQDEIAEAVVAAMRVRLLGELPHSYLTSPDAYALYLRAAHLMAQQSRTSLEGAELLLLRVLEIDPDYVPALTRMAGIYVTLGSFNFRPLSESFERARQYAQRSIELDPHYTNAYSVMGFVALQYDRDLAAAEKFLRKSLSADRNSPDTLTDLATLASIKGQHDRGAQLLLEAIALDPFSAMLYFKLGVTKMFYLRQYGDSADAFRQAILLSPDTLAAHFGLGQSLFLAGDFENALIAFEGDPEDFFRLVGQALCHYALGDIGESNAALDQLIRDHAEHGGAQIAEIYAVRGDIDLAFEWLERARLNHDTGVGTSSKRNPFLENLRDDPRMDEFIERLEQGAD